MKATGIIRRIDELGRIVIPRDIRRQLNINEGDPLEIFVNKGGVFLIKYNASNEFVKHIEQIKYNMLIEEDVENIRDVLEKLDEAISILQKDN